MDQLLKTAIETAVVLQAMKKTEFERVSVDTTVQEKAIAHPTDARLPGVDCQNVLRHSKRVGIALKQTYEREGKALRRGFAHAKQFKHLKTVLKRQRIILGVLVREVTLKMTQMADMAAEVKARLSTVLERAVRIRMYAMHPLEVECIGKGKARKPYEFGVKASIAGTDGGGFLLGVRTLSSNPYDGHTLATRIEQTTTLLDKIGIKPTAAVVDLGYRGVDEDVPTVRVIHRGKAKSLTVRKKTWLKRLQAVEPAIFHVKADKASVFFLLWLWSLLHVVALVERLATIGRAKGNQDRTSRRIGTPVPAGHQYMLSAPG